MCTVMNYKNQYMMKNQYTEAVFQIFFKIGVVKNFSNLTRNYLCSSLFLINLLPKDLQLCQKEAPTQVYSSEICQIFKNISG